MPRLLQSRFSRFALVATLLMIAACDVLGPDAWEERREAFEDNRSRWTSQSIDTYRYVSTKNCECIPGFAGPVEIAVSSGTITGITPLNDRVSVPRDQWPAFDTVEDMFELIDRALADRAHEFQASYDSNLGYPTQISIDFVERIADDEVLIQVEELEVIE